MYTFLEKISIEDLWDYLSKTTKFSFPPIESINRELLYNLIFAWYGYDLLYEKGFRRLLLQTLSEPELKKLAVEIGVNAEQKVLASQYLTGEQIVLLFGNLKKFLRSL